MLKVLAVARAGLFALALGGSAAHAQSAVHIVVPFAPGGAQDVIGRWFADKLAPRLGEPVIVENKPGAGGLLAADAVAKAAPDGKTILLATGGAISIAPHLNSKLPYNPARDFASIAMVADTPMTIAVRADSPYKTLADVLRDAKSQPGKLAYASTGNATVSHLTGALLAQAAGIELLHVPYKGAAPAISDLLGGQLPLIVTSAASIDPMAEAGKVRVLATFSKAPLANFAKVPTVSEATGLPGLDVPVWVGFLAPARTPADRLDRLAAEILAVCRLPETQERFRGLGAVSLCAPRSDLEKMIGEDTARWGKVVKQGNIKLD
jgi:tripartite-type tricarboxylate transporter receptor subunit TctC